MFDLVAVFIQDSSIVWDPCILRYACCRAQFSGFSVHCFSCGLLSTPQRPHEGLANPETTMHSCNKQAEHLLTKTFRQPPRLAFSAMRNAQIVCWQRSNPLCFEQILLLPSSLNVRPQDLVPRETGLGCDLRSHYLDRSPWSASRLLSKGMVLSYWLPWWRANNATAFLLAFSVHKVTQAVE